MGRQNVLFIPGKLKLQLFGLCFEFEKFAGKPRQIVKVQNYGAFNQNNLTNFFNDFLSILGCRESLLNHGISTRR